MMRRIPPAESTEAPWWVIIDPCRMMKPEAHRVANMITGPFLSRATAQAEIDNHGHRYGKHAVVYCMSGYRSAEWKALCAEEVSDERAS